MLSTPINNDLQIQRVESRLALPLISALKVDQNSLSFKFDLNFKRIAIKMISWEKRDEKEAIKKFVQNSENWIDIEILDSQISTSKYGLDLDLGITFGLVKIQEKEKLNTEIIRTRKDEKLKINVQMYDLLSYKMDDSQLKVQVIAGHLHLLFDPITLNSFVKFLRSNRPPGKEQPIIPVQSQCTSVHLIPIKFSLNAQGFHVLALHSSHKDAPFFNLDVDSGFELEYDMGTDHDVFALKMSGIGLQDLTKYPYTINPADYGGLKPILDNQDELTKNSTKMISFEGDKPNTLSLSCPMYRKECEYFSPDCEMKLFLEIKGLGLVYLQEYLFRVMDYFFDKFIWALTCADPYMNYPVRDDSLIPHDELAAFDLQQPPVTMSMDIKLSDTKVVLLDRPDSPQALNVAIDHITVQSDASYQREEKLFKNFPEKVALTSGMKIQVMGVTINDRIRDEMVSPSFNIEVKMRSLIKTEHVRRVSCDELDKSTHIQVVFLDDLKLDLSQELYTYLLRCSDLNLTYQDTLQPHFDTFRILPDYFNLQGAKLHLPKQNIQVSIPRIEVSLSSEDLGGSFKMFVSQANIDVSMVLDDEMSIKNSFKTLGGYLLGQIGEKCIFSGLQGNRVTNDLEMLIHMYPDRKVMNINMSNVALFAEYYELMALKHFLLEGMPKYKVEDRDKPFGIKEDDQDCSGIDCNLNLTGILICIPDESNNGLVLGTDLTFKFERFNIKSVKDTVKQNSNPDHRAMYVAMIADIKTLSGYVCDLNDFKEKSFDQIRKRQIFSDLSLKYQDVGFLAFDKKVLTGQKTQVKIKSHLKTALSISDLLLLSKVNERLSAGMKKFNVFINGYENTQDKRIIEEQVDLMKIDIQEFEAKTKGAYIVILDEIDKKPKPSLALVLTNLTFKSCMNPATEASKARLSASLNYFDAWHSFWEPLIEPFELTYHHSNNTQHIELSPVLNLNLTPEAVSTLSSLQSNSDQLISEWERKRANYLNVNEVISFTVENHSKREVEIDRVEVPAGGGVLEYQWDIQNEAKRYLRKYNQSFYERIPHHTLTCGNHKLHLTQNSQHVKTITLPNEHLFIGFEGHQPSRKLIIRNKYCLKNMSTDMVLKVQDRRGDGQMAYVVGPRQVRGVSEMKWSDMEFVVGGEKIEVSFERDSSESKIIQIRNGQNVDRLAVISVNQSTLSDECFDFILQDTVEILNLLPFPISFDQAADQIPPDSRSSIPLTAFKSITLHMQGTLYTASFPALPAPSTTVPLVFRSDHSAQHASFTLAYTPTLTLTLYAPLLLHNPSNLLIEAQETTSTTMQTILWPACLEIVRIAGSEVDITKEGMQAIQAERGDRKSCQFRVKVASVKKNGVERWVVMINPAYKVMNKTAREMYYKVSGQDQGVKIAQGVEVPLEFPQIQGEEVMKISFKYSNTIWSLPNKLDTPVSKIIELQDENDFNEIQNLKFVIQQDVQTGQTCITISEPVIPEIVINNYSQWKVSISGQQNRGDQIQITRNRTMTYQWNDENLKLDQRENMLYLQIQGQSAALDLDNIGTQTELKLSDEHSVFVWTQLGPELGIILNITEKPKSDMKTLLNVKGINLSMVVRQLNNTLIIGGAPQSQRKELALISLKNILVESVQSLKTQKNKILLGSIQVDHNSQIQVNFPTIIYPKRVAEDYINERTAFMCLEFTVKKASRNTISEIDKINFSLKTFYFKIDDGFIKEMQDFLSIFQQSQSMHEQNFSIEKKELKDRPLDQITDINELQISDLDVRFSFYSGTNMGEVLKNMQFDNQLLNQLAQLFMKVSANLSKCPIKISGKSFIRPFEETKQEDEETLGSYYFSGLKKNFVNFVAHNEILGNPSDLLNQISSGTEDFFKLTLQGIKSGNPKKMGDGVAEGTKNLAQKTLTGIFKFLHTFSNSASHMAVIATQDRNFEERRTQSMREEAKNPVDGVGQGLQHLMAGIADGVTGFVKEPVQQTRQNGLRGFLGGTWSGTKGLVLKPVSGYLDLISKSSSGVLKSVGVEQVKIERTRKIRAFYDVCHYIQPFEDSHAHVSLELKTLFNKEYSRLYLLDSYCFNSGRDFKILVFGHETLLVINGITLSVDFETPPHTNLIQPNQEINQRRTVTTTVLKLLCVQQGQTEPKSVSLRVNAEVAQIIRDKVSRYLKYLGEQQ